MSRSYIRDLNLQDPILPRHRSHRTANTVGLEKTTEKREVLKEDLMVKGDDRNRTGKAEERTEKSLLVSWVPCLAPYITQYYKIIKFTP